MGEDYFSGGGNYFSGQGTDYFGDIDSFASHPQYFSGDIYGDAENQQSSDDGLNFTAKSMGANTDPMGNTLESLKSRIREGTGRVEFNFLQPGKGNARSPSPEMFGSKERRDMRELVKMNEMKTSVHAPVTEQSLAGFDPQSGSFREENRAKVQREIKRAIDFASEAGTGGAVVFHMHEWNRPVEELNEKDDNAEFAEYPGPRDPEDTNGEDSGVKYVVDERNGQPIRESAIQKDQTVYRPKYKTADSADDVEPGDEVPVEGRDGETRVLQEKDWVSLDGKYVPENADTDILFKRVPEFNDDQEVEVEELTWEDIQERAQDYNEKFDEDMKPEEYYAQVELENTAMQARGQSLRASRQYQQNKRRYEQLKETYEKYKDLKEDLPEDEEWKAEQLLPEPTDQQLPTENKEEYIEEQLKTLQNELKYAHDASSSADAQAQEIKEKINNLSTVEDYGQDKTADTIANAADYAMQMYEKRKDKYDLEDPIYVAPENWNHQFYGSHPEEYKDIIDNAREEFVERLQKRDGMDEDTARDKAETHIQGTLDIGHMNTFRDRFKRKDGEELDEYEERFNDWLLNETEELVEEGYVGHVHLNDNFGYEDEHVTPGEGNAPMREFLENLEEQGMDDIIVEQGSFNDQAHLETLNLANSPVYGAERSQRMQSTRRGHWGYRSPAMFMAGSYAPSNDFQLWTQTPLE